MGDNETAAAIGIAVFILAVTLLLSFTGLAKDRMRYENFLRAQAVVLACRAERPNAADNVCGPVPSFAEFK
jgi:hypothetical protein